MRAAIPLGDVVGEAQHRLVIAVGPLQGQLDGNAVTLAGHDHGLVQGLMRAVEIFDESLETAFILQVDDHRLGFAIIAQLNVNTRVQKRQFAQAMLQAWQLEIHVGEGLARRGEANLGAGAAHGIAGDRQIVVRHPVLKADVMLLVVTPDPHFEGFRERVDDGNTDAVQAAGDFVGVLVELTAGMQLGHDDLGRRDAFLVMDINRNPAPVIPHRRGAVSVQDHLDQIAMSGQRLVDGVVHDLVDHVVQARAVIGVADIHARTLTHGVQAAQDLDRSGVVIVFVALGGGRGIGHDIAYLCVNAVIANIGSISVGLARRRER